MSCCKGHTYKCDRCRQKFCERCQRSDEYKGREYCSTCYYTVKGQDASDDDDKLKELERQVESLQSELDCSRNDWSDGASYRLSQILDLLATQPDKIDRNELIKELKDKFD